MNTPICEAKSPYGVAKLYGRRIISAYRQRKYGLHACSGIMFNRDKPAIATNIFRITKDCLQSCGGLVWIRNAPELDKRGGR